MARPKLEPGEKGNYNLSRKEKAKRSLKTTIRNSNRREAAAKKTALSKRNVANQAKKALTALESGGTLTGEAIKSLPPNIKKAIDANEVEIAFEPNEGPQTEFLSSPQKEVLYGGAAGGGKSYAMLMDLLRYADNRNHRALLLRRTLAELTELIDKSKQIYPMAFPNARFKESTKTWEFPSGATALFSYVDKDDDVYRYQGQSFTWIGIDELGHYPSPYVWNYLR